MPEAIPDRDPAPRVAERVWRARKNHAWIDAQLHLLPGAGFELRLFYDGDVVFSRRWATREGALAQAARQLQELQRAGWTAHW
jgi:hypothetical protein